MRTTINVPSKLIDRIYLTMIGVMSFDEFIAYQIATTATSVTFYNVVVNFILVLG